MTSGITRNPWVIPVVTPKWVNNTNVHSKFTLISLFSKIHSLKSEHIHSFCLERRRLKPWSLSELYAWYGFWYSSSLYEDKMVQSLMWSYFLYNFHLLVSNTMLVQFLSVFNYKVNKQAHFLQELLLNSRHTKPYDMYKVFQFLFGSRLMGHGLVSEIDHEKWFHKRAIINPAFRRRWV